MKTRLALSLAEESEILAPEAIADLREALLERRQERREQLRALTNQADAATDVVTIRRVDSVHEVLALIDAALARMRNGIYGRCLHCSSMIPLPRLQLLPYADGCVTCLRRLAARR